MSFNVLKEVRVDDAGQLLSFVEIGGKPVQVAFAALPGSQDAFLRCGAFEVLYEGTRGCGKTIALIMDFCQFVGQGMGLNHRGIILRRTFPELEFVEATARKWIPKIFPGATFNAQQHVWTFPDGATLRFGYLEFPEQFEQLYNGKEFTFVGLEQLENWPDCECLKLMISCLRNQPILHLRATCNTFGIGADAIKERYRLPLVPFNRTIGPPIDDAVDDQGRPEPPRRVVHGDISENLYSRYLDPTYMSRTLTSTSNPHKARAWATGEWTDNPLSVFADIDWNEVRVPVFEVPEPKKLRIGYDFGDGSPYSFLVFYPGNGESIPLPDGTVHNAPPNSLYIVGEIYGGVKNQGLHQSIEMQAARLRRLFESRGWDTSVFKREGNIADASIFDERVQFSTRSSYAMDFERAGIHFLPSDKGSGSRVQGLGQMRKMLLAAAPPREQAGLFVCDCCPEFLKHIPALQRSKTNPEDVDTEGGDHDYDACRYFLRREKPQVVRFGRIEQLYPNAHRNARRLTI
ncbi:MAG: hypothetical protein ACLPTZ_11155 [Beijerinckiaceae bacterium]